jgi:hypothetical protein
MENIVEPNETFDFNQLTLAHPSGIQGGAYFTKIEYNKKPLYIQTTKGQTRQGFVKTGKKYYCDLMFDKNSETLLNWFENLEERCQNLLYDKRYEWFQSALEKNDIETAFNSSIRIYKSGKYYLIRTNIKTTRTEEPAVKIYNENEAILNMSDITNETNIISILEIQGIKFTSRNFQIDIEVKQVMLLNKDIIFENCLIKKNKDGISKTTLTPPSLVLHPSPEPKDSILQISNKMVMNDKTTHVEENPIISQNVPDNLEEMKEIKEIKVDEEVVGINGTDKIEEDKPDEVESDEEDENDDEDEPDETPEIKLEIEKPNINLEITDTPFVNKNDGLSEDDLVDSILESMEPSNELTEFNIDLHLDNTSKDTIELKKPERVYYEMYLSVREKAKKAKQEAMLAYLEAKNIKKTYMLENLSDSSEDSMDDMSDTEDE